MEFKGREQRAECYKSRDAYFECVEKQTTENDRSKTNCQELYKSFEKTCGKKWTEHFIRRKDYLKFKDKIEKEGVENIDKQKF